MNNAELIKALKDAEMYVPNCYASREAIKAIRDAADALEAADKRIAELSLDCELFQQKCMELEAQLPKEGEWIESNTRPRSAKFYCSVCHRTCYDIQPTRDKAWTKRCRYHYCPNCGAKMKGANDERD